MNIMEKLSCVQEELKAPKSKYNSFGKYNYRSCEDILEGAKPLLKKHGLAMTLSDSIEQIGERYYIKATANVADLESGEIHSVSALAREPFDKKGMDDSQISGTASSYARKYALNGLFLIDDTKDADTDEYHNQTATSPANKAELKADATAPVCDKCGKLIVGYEGRNGKMVTSEQHIAATKKMFGKALCVECAKEIKAKKEG